MPVTHTLNEPSCVKRIWGKVEVMVKITGKAFPLSLEQLR
jgi:hypothetical protein